MSNINSSIHGMKLSRHPVAWVAQILAPWINYRAEVQMSKYHYVPQSFNDSRYEFWVPVPQLNENTLLNMLMSLEPECELAMHSKVVIDNNSFHIPMIDFGSKGSSPAASETLKELCRYWNMGFNIYESGRSFHAYGNRLLTHAEWLQFMGSLLLLNRPSGYKLIDERWVGHRIMGGYSALRWSKNTSHYKRFPTHCGYLSGDQFMINTTENFISPPPLPNINPW
ncbi:hypothetical protein ACOHX9_000714 [Yersinia enterocolitica]|uniref:primase 1D-like protein n=1 Tax=Yersinia enterocolitica TaxID=630 RepID=UPI0021E86A3A|nr:hypothetical protein [Yersinia enterocolitica]UYK17001.1 hypothetical protein N4220_11565 [Yersinia enterocolitica]HDL7321570.1 hypothetical protein [Yersinia enterocolitica]